MTQNKQLTNIPMPNLEARCLACKEMTNAYDPCCNSTTWTQGQYYNAYELRSDWEQQTSRLWRNYFNE